MKKTFNYYSICWLISLVVFNVIAFVTPNDIAGVSKFTGTFWSGYIFITLTFIGQLGCAYKAFQADNLKNARQIISRNDATEDGKNHIPCWKA